VVLSLPPTPGFEPGCP